MEISNVNGHKLWTEVTGQDGQKRQADITGTIGKQKQWAEATGRNNGQKRQAV